ncbi:cell wall protein [Streptomyces sp. NPDC047017]|uniref:cell wall protein n=1 Tax=Streptomyces sp. NPDC047017 TaxID=3155024 RepID=UPI0033C9C4D6
MSSARRTLLTATAAGTLLGALWFVPSASATGGTPARTVADSAPAGHLTQQGRAADPAVGAAGAAGRDTGAGRQAEPAAAGSETGSGSGSGAGSGSESGSGSANALGVPGGTELADTGSIDTTPYVIGGSLFLAVGAGFVVYSVRRERLGS